MASTFTVNRAHLIYGLCLPLALLLGYLLAEPLESSSLAVVVLVLSILITPLLMKWYHPVLVLCWNSTFYFPFLPGQPPAWIGLVALGMGFILLNRCVDPRRRLMVGGAVAWSLLALAAVAIITALSTGGIGLRAMGSATFGGRKYIYLAAAIIGYFVMASQRVPKTRVWLYAGLFFLSGLTTLIGYVAYQAKVPPAFLLVSPEAVADATAIYDTSGVPRITGIVSLSTAMCLFLLARYGVAGILDLRKPWRLFLTVFFLVAGLYSGFRSFFGFLVLVYTIAFFVEGLHRTRYLLTAILAGALTLAGLAAFATKLPLSIQRSLSFLPIEISPAAAAAAKVLLDWRVDMWKEVATDVPRYFFRGKGYVIDPTEMFFSHQNVGGFDIPAEWAVVSGDYHNGPLSVLIPFGIWGALAFTWFLFVSIRLLYRYCRHGDPALGIINRAIFACFIARLVFFVFLVGGLTADLPYFVSLVGLAICFNGELPKQGASEPEPEEESLPAPAF